MLRRKILPALLAIAMLAAACGKNKPEPEVQAPEESSSINEIVLSDENKEDPDDNEDDTLQKPDEAARINVKAAVTGDCTGIGFAPIMGWGEKDKNHEKYELTVKPTVEETAAVLESGEADVAILPLDTAVKMYNKDGNVVLLATNTYNNIYIADLTGEVREKADLNGKTVTFADDGSLSASVAKKVLEKAGALTASVGDSEALQAGLANSSIQIAISPEPYITRAKLKHDSIELGPDVGELWSDVDGSDIVSSVLVARKDFVESNGDSMIYILDDFRQSVNTVIYGVTKTLDYSSRFNIVPDKSEAISSMKNCNFTFTEGEDMQQAVEAFLNANGDAVSAMPGADFYYIQ